YDWPGNVRELQNLVQRMCILHSGDIVNADDLPRKFRELEVQTEHSNPGHKKTEPDISAPMDFNTMSSEFENKLILKALHKTGWNKKEAAQLLNMKRTTLLEKIKKKNLDREKTGE
ncbi:MAG: helix-turn-helix domain-containing protein, partial [Desulfosalsimonas sp.]